MEINICREIKDLIMQNLDKILALRNTAVIKDDGTYVSQGDLLCQSLIMDFIRDLMKENYYIISEEIDIFDSNDINNNEYVFTIDPIDGTENFICGLKEWGIGVSIYRNLTHYQSMILLPELREYLISGDKINETYNSRICGLSSYMTKKDFFRIEQGFEFRIFGCCMYNMFNAIRGSFAQFQHITGCYSWDILPGLNLALENKKYVEVNGMPYNGEFLFPKQKYRFIIK